VVHLQRYGIFKLHRRPPAALIVPTDPTEKIVCAGLQHHRNDPVVRDLQIEKAQTAVYP
jgi:hypothetical protein